MIQYNKDQNIEKLTTTKNSITLKPMKHKTGMVDYTTRSAARTVWIESLGIWASPFLVKGNAKLDKGILIFDLLAIGSCGNCKTCSKSCYARKAQVQYTGTYNKRAINTYMVKHDLETLESEIIKQLYKSSDKIVRVHSSGDFISQEEVNTWFWIANLFPEKKFYCYTKMNKILDTDRLNRLSNFNVINSILANGQKNYGTMADFRIAKKENPGLKLCSYGIAKKDHMAHCGTTCTKCLRVESMFFIEH